MKVFRKLRPIFDTHHAHESQISPVAPSWFFTASFFLPLLSRSFFLGKTVSYRELLFFRFSPFFSEEVLHDVECFYCCNVTENGRSM